MAVALFVKGVALLYICLVKQNLAAAFKLVLNAYPLFLASR